MNKGLEIIQLIEISGGLQTFTESGENVVITWHPELVKLLDIYVNSHILHSIRQLINQKEN